jgi:hypothetical protein
MERVRIVARADEWIDALDLGYLRPEICADVLDRRCAPPGAPFASRYDGVA